MVLDALQGSRRLGAVTQGSSVAELQPEQGLAPPEEPSRLQNFVNWLAGNGLQGIGGDNANVAIYQDADGMRGIVCMKVIYC